MSGQVASEREIPVSRAIGELDEAIRILSERSEELHNRLEKVSSAPTPQCGQEAKAPEDPLGTSEFVQQIRSFTGRVRGLSVGVARRLEALEI